MGEIEEHWIMSDEEEENRDVYLLYFEPCHPPWEADAMSVEERASYPVLSGCCPDDACKTKLYFPAYDDSIECTSCGQRHPKEALKNITEATTSSDVRKYLYDVLVRYQKPKKGPESVKVLGRSNYECKIVSPILTKYGMDNKTGKARLLSEMGRGDMFDFACLSDRAFMIEPDQIGVSGYGRDHTGSMSYLKDTLAVINSNEECFLPIHADGDGHCLVHAISRALIGRELFWHPLRANLKAHIIQERDRYMELFGNYIDQSEWPDIIKECDPDYVLSTKDTMGLRNIHIFGLANVLRRPIILLDSIEGIMNSGDYTGIFLPGLRLPDECKNKKGELNKPLCLAWSSNGHNHYIAMVGVKGRPVPKIPNWIIHKCGVWGMSQDRLLEYLDMDEDGAVVIGGTKGTGDQYLLRLMRAMEEVFLEKYGVVGSLVSDLHHYVLKSAGIVGFCPDVVITETARAVQEKRLFRCISCQALSMMSVPSIGFQPTGHLYKLAINCHGKLDHTKRYSFPTEGIICSYDEKEDCLVPERLSSCGFCEGTQMRLVTGDGSVCFLNGDRTITPTTNSKCTCGYKHYWDEKEYDNRPTVFPVTLKWGGKVLGEKVVWFQDESDPTLNSNAFEIANRLVQKHFPGEFGSEQLVQKVVEQILRETASLVENSNPQGDKENQPMETPWNETVPTKIILTGQNRKTLHKEELYKSQTEKMVRHNIETKARQTQRRRTIEQAKQAPSSQSSPTKVNPKFQKTVVTPQNTLPSSPPRDSLVGAAASTPSPSQTGVKQVRVSTSDGRRLQLKLKPDVTFSGLQDMLTEEFKVPAAQQRIKYGYPPKILTQPESPDEGPLPLGDRETLVLEIIPDASGGGSPRHDTLAAQSKSLGTIVSNESQDAKLLRDIASLQNVSEMDDIDQTITALALTSSLLGSNLWSQVQTMPHLFSPGGAFYEQLKRDMGLKDEKHYQFPTLPGKTFRYNAASDVLELCLEPHGHFVVSKGIEDQILNRRVPLPTKMDTSSLHDLGSLQETGRALKSGASGVVVNPHITRPSPHIPFSGKGHTMSGGPNPRSEERKEVSMETDQTLPNTTPTSHPNPQIFQRVGPGYRVARAEAENEANSTVDCLMSVAKDIVAAESEKVSYSEGESQEAVVEAGAVSVDEASLLTESNDILDRALAALEEEAGGVQKVQNMEVDDGGVLDETEENIKEVTADLESEKESVPRNVDVNSGLDKMSETRDDEATKTITAESRLKTDI